MARKGGKFCSETAKLLKKIVFFLMMKVLHLSSLSVSHWKQKKKKKKRNSMQSDLKLYGT